jgi:hypothetical protein
MSALRQEMHRRKILGVLVVLGVIVVSVLISAQDSPPKPPKPPNQSNPRTRASGGISGIVSPSHGVHSDASPSSTITTEEASDLINLLPNVNELRGRAMDVKWDLRAGPSMNNRNYYFVWVYNATAQKKGDISSISVGNYAVNKHTADVRAWQVSQDIFYGDDGVFVTSNELEQLQEELRKRHGLNSTLVQKYRAEHLANRIIPRGLAQSAVQLPITHRSSETAEVSCWVNSDHPVSRLGHGPIVSSSAGDRAYAEVKAIALRPKYEETYTGSHCENSVKLFLAEGVASSFTILLDSNRPKNYCITVDGKDSCEVNGIQLVDWSKDGRFLLADLVLWHYESDAWVMRVPIIYDTRAREFMRPDVYHFFDQYYRTDAAKEECIFQLLTEGFSPEGDLILSATRREIDPGEEPVFCLDDKQTFLFELGANKITRLPANYKTQHYGTWTSGSS